MSDEPGRPRGAAPPAEVLDLPVSIDPAEVRRWLGYPEGRRPPARIEALLERLLEEARRLVAARGAFALLDGARAPALGLDAAAGDGLLVGLVTVGPALEARASELLDRGEATAALVLDAAGTAAVEEAADRLAALALAGEDEGAGESEGAEAEPTGDADAVGRAVPCRMSPGYGRWPLERQRELLGLLPSRDVGVRLLPSLLMEPRKSVSFAVWLGAGGRPGEPASGCAFCGLEACRYRRAPRRAAQEG